MTIDRKAKTLYIISGLIVVFSIVFSTAYYWYENQKYDIRNQNIIDEKMAVYAKKTSEIDRLKKNIANIDKRIENTKFNTVDIESLKKIIIIILQEITFADCKLVDIKYHSQYSNLVNIKIKVNSKNSSPDELVALGLIEVFKTKEFTKLFKPLKNKFLLHGSVIEFIYFKEIK